MKYDSNMPFTAENATIYCQGYGRWSYERICT